MLASRSTITCQRSPQLERASVTLYASSPHRLLLPIPARQRRAASASGTSADPPARLAIGEALLAIGGALLAVCTLPGMFNVRDNVRTLQTKPGRRYRNRSLAK